MKALQFLMVFALVGTMAMFSCKDKVNKAELEAQRIADSIRIADSLSAIELADSLARVADSLQDELDASAVSKPKPASGSTKGSTGGSSSSSGSHAGHNHAGHNHGTTTTTTTTTTGGGDPIQEKKDKISGTVEQVKNTVEDKKGKMQGTIDKVEKTIEKKKGKMGGK